MINLIPLLAFHQMVCFISTPLPTTSHMVCFILFLCGPLITWYGSFNYSADPHHMVYFISISLPITNHIVCSILIPLMFPLPIHLLSEEHNLV